MTPLVISTDPPRTTIPTRRPDVIDGETAAQVLALTEVRSDPGAGVRRRSARSLWLARRKQLRPVQLDLRSLAIRLATRSVVATARSHSTKEPLQEACMEALTQAQDSRCAVLRGRASIRPLRPAAGADARRLDAAAGCLFCHLALGPLNRTVPEGEQVLHRQPGSAPQSCRRCRRQRGGCGAARLARTRLQRLIWRGSDVEVSVLSPLVRVPVVSEADASRCGRISTAEG